MERARTISKSMISYLKKAREQKEFLLKEVSEFDRSKRHLANIMGVDAKEMTQDDIDQAIAYLFPSGLFDKKARPMLKHPDLLYKTEKGAFFDIEGRPHHHLFYTEYPNYHETLSKIRDTVFELNAFEDKQIAKGVVDPPSGSCYEFNGREWFPAKTVTNMFLEEIKTNQYEYFVRSLQALVNHPYSNRAKELIEKYSSELPGQSLNLELPELSKDEKTGEIFAQLKTRRRNHVVSVKTVLNGSGKVDIDGHDILYFDDLYLRRAVYFPLQISGMQDKVDIYAKLVSRPAVLGTASVAMAIRFAVAQTVAAFVDKELREKMRLAGLLTPDTRMKERKKFGQEGARRKYTWKRR